jgi:hypothetical protein
MIYGDNILVFGFQRFSRIPLFFGDFPGFWSRTPKLREASVLCVGGTKPASPRNPRANFLSSSPRTGRIGGLMASNDRPSFRFGIGLEEAALGAAIRGNFAPGSGLQPRPERCLRRPFDPLRWITVSGDGIADEPLVHRLRALRAFRRAHGVTVLVPWGDSAWALLQTPQQVHDLVNLVGADAGYQQLHGQLATETDRVSFTLPKSVCHR